MNRKLLGPCFPSLADHGFLATSARLLKRWRPMPTFTTGMPAGKLTHPMQLPHPLQWLQRLPVFEKSLRYPISRQ